LISPSWADQLTFAAEAEAEVPPPGANGFRSNFDQTAINQPPASMQGVGTAAIAGPPGSVLVVAAPGGLNGKWLRLRRPNADSGFPGNKNTRAAGDIAARQGIVAAPSLPKDCPARCRQSI
jgi:hypothetical protein